MFVYFKEHNNYLGMDLIESVCVDNFYNGKALYTSCYMTGNTRANRKLECSQGELEIPFWDSRIAKPNFRRRISRRENLRREKESRKARCAE